MIVGNLFFIKSSSGLFHYGVDYLQECPGSIRKILVKPVLLKVACAAFPGQAVQVCSVWRMCWEVLRAAVRGDVIFTPTSHPLPCLSRQWVVVHDGYPFVAGFKGRLKRFLLRCSLASSDCRVAYINQAETASFVLGLGVDRRRALFAPNRFPQGGTLVQSRPSAIGERLKVALVGTESLKKNYAALFAAVVSAGVDADVHFYIYGHRNAYLNQLVVQFPQVRITLVSSDEQTISGFLGAVDLLVSVARMEGFGRPIAAALMNQVPCLLLDCPVFREFFDPGAHFYACEADLVGALQQCVAGAEFARPRYCAPVAALQGYAHAISVLKADGAMASS